MMMMMMRSILLLCWLAASGSAFAPTRVSVTTVRHAASSMVRMQAAASPEYASLMLTPSDAYHALAKKGAGNAKMSKRKILHQSILGGAYVGFGGLVSLCIAGNLGGIGAANPGIPKMMFAALFPVNLLLIVATGGQLFTGNSAAVSAARWEGLCTWRDLGRSWGVSLGGNVIGCGLFAIAAWYTGVLTGGAAELCSSTALTKCTSPFFKTIVKALLCNWMVSLAVFLSGASNDLAGKMVGIWFPISTFVAIGLEHSIANLFILPAALLLRVPLTITDVLMRNVFPVIIGNAIAGMLVVAGSYSYQFGRLGMTKEEKDANPVNGGVLSDKTTAAVGAASA